MRKKNVSEWEFIRFVGFFFLCLFIWKIEFIRPFICSVSDTGETQCSLDPSGNSWVCTSGLSRIICSVDDSGHGILCVDQQHCPYAEEIQPVHVTVFVSSDSFLLENYSTLFLLSEIGQSERMASRHAFLYETWSLVVSSSHSQSLSLCHFEPRQ